MYICIIGQTTQDKQARMPDPLVIRMSFQPPGQDNGTSAQLLLALTIWNPDPIGSFVFPHSACQKTVLRNLCEANKRAMQSMFKLLCTQATRLHGHGRGRHHAWVEKRAQGACRHDPARLSNQAVRDSLGYAGLGFRV